MAAPVGCAHEHLVELYETDAFLVDSVTRFLLPALRSDRSAIVVATAEHREEFARALADGGVDVEHAIREGRYLALDAAETLASFMVHGRPHEHRFREQIGGLIGRMAIDGRRVNVYGEMVALLWADGDVASAIALEDLWNRLATVRSFDLLCAYPMSTFDDEGSAEAFKRMCEQHTSVIPAEGYSLLPDAEGQRRHVAALQRRASSLGAELDRLRAEQPSLVALAYQDSLTGLGNRHSFMMHMDREWALTQRDGVDSYVLVTDLDRFKALNDTYGHAAGDEALQRFAEALRIAARSTDILARLGGDEFGVLLVRCDERAAHSFTARLREAAAGLVWPGFRPVSISAGHASLVESISPGKALDRADLAMLAKKRTGRVLGYDQLSR